MPSRRDDFDSACPLLPCPFCELGLPHNVQTEQVCDHWFSYHSAHWEQHQASVLAYHTKLMAYIAIVALHGRPLPPPPPAQSAAGAASSEASPISHVAPAMDELRRSRGPVVSSNTSSAEPSFYKHKGAYHASYYDYASLRGFVWQYAGGKRHRWTEYDDSVQDEIEAAYTTAPGDTYDLVVSDWHYMLDFEALTQTSVENETTRAIRRWDRDEFLMNATSDA